MRAAYFVNIILPCPPRPHLFLGLREMHSHSPRGQWPSPVFSTERQTLHKSTFQAHASRLSPTFPASLVDPSANAKATSGAIHAALEPLFDAITRSHPQTKRATHCMYAWCAAAAVPPAPPSTTLRLPTKENSRKAKEARVENTSSRPTLLLGSSSGGESGSGARLEQLLQMRGCADVVVVVYRWYGGVPLGNARWRCITGAAKEALQAGGWS